MHKFIKTNVINAIKDAYYLTLFNKIVYMKLLGILLMAASENEDNDILWCVNHDTFPFQKPMMETQVRYPESSNLSYNVK